jgi:hypothetical protein
MRLMRSSVSWVSGVTTIITFSWASPATATSISQSQSIESTQAAGTEEVALSSDESFENDSLHIDVDSENITNNNAKRTSSVLDGEGEKGVTELKKKPNVATDD